MKPLTYTLSWEQRISLNRGTLMSIQGDYDTIKYLWKTFFQNPSPEIRRNIQASFQKNSHTKPKPFDPHNSWPRLDFTGGNTIVFT